MTEGKTKTKGIRKVQRSVKKLPDAESIINRSPVIYCVWRLGETWPVEYISGNIAEWGYSADDFLSGRLTWQAITHPDDAPRVEAEVLRFMKDKTNHFAQTYRIIDKHGKTRWVEDQNVFIFAKNGRITHLQGAVLDITERKLSQQALEQAEQRTQELLAKSSDIIVVLDEAGVFRYVSPSVKTLLGYNQDELNGHSAFDYIHPEDIKNVSKALREVILHQNKGIATELRFRHADSCWISLEALGNNCLTNSAIGGIIINARDVSERKRLEAQLLHSQKMEAIGRLASGIAHDFNNILMGIQGYISLLLLKMDTIHPDFEKLLNIQTLVQSGADLTGKLLGFARGGRFELSPTDINALIAKTVNLFGRTKKEITVHQRFPAGPAVAEVDRVQIEQVLLNLFVNAWQAMPQGGEIFVETQPVTFSRSVPAQNIRKGKYIKITIRDTGRGIDEETRQHIFEPFFTTKERGRGVGLGLASAYGIVRDHKGAIEVDSAPNRGTQFVLYLPASEKDVPEETYASKTIFKGTETILLVDDEDSILDVCRDILISLGYKIRVASDGPTAVDLYAQEAKDIDLVILDMIMPGMNGAQTFAAIRQINPNARVIVSTGYSNSREAQKLLDGGCRGLIAKPFRIEELSQKIRDVLDR